VADGNEISMQRHHVSQQHRASLTVPAALIDEACTNDADGRCRQTLNPVRQHKLHLRVGSHFKDVDVFVRAKVWPPLAIAL